MKKSLGLSIAFRFISNKLNFSDKNLKIRAAVYLLLSVSSLLNIENTYAKCPPTGLGYFLELLSLRNPRLHLQGDKVQLQGVGPINQNTFALIKSLGLVDAADLSTKMFHHSRAQALAQSPLFKKLLLDLQAQYGVPTDVEIRIFRTKRTWKDLISVLNEVISHTSFRNDAEVLSQRLGASLEETLQLVFFENSLSAKDLLEKAPLLLSETERLGLSGFGGLAKILPLYNYGVLENTTSAAISNFVMKTGLVYEHFLVQWSTRFPSISLQDLDALWPHVLAAAKILRENRQFTVDPMEFLARVHAVDCTLVGTLQKFGFLPKTSTPHDGIDLVRNDLRGWRAKLVEAKKDRQFLNPNIVNDIKQNYINDISSSLLFEIIAAPFYAATLYEKLMNSIRNLVTDIFADLFLCLAAPDNATRIMAENLKGPERLAAVERFLQKYAVELGEHGKYSKEKEDALLRELWKELNPKANNLTEAEVEAQIAKGGFWSDMRGNLSKSDFIKGWLRQTLLRNIVMVPVGAVAGATANGLTEYASNDEASLYEILKAASFGAITGAIFYGAWVSPKYALMYSHYTERIARVLYRKGISTLSPEYEALRAQMTSTATRYNAWSDNGTFILYGILLRSIFYPHEDQRPLDQGSPFIDTEEFESRNK